MERGSSAPTGKRILLLGSGTSAFLATVRSLGRRGHVVYCGWGDVDDETFLGEPEAGSRYIRERLSLARPTEAGWAQAMVSVLRARRIDVVMPCDDAALVALDSRRTLFDADVVLAMPSAGAISLLTDKVASAAAARECGIPVAAGMQVVSLADVAEAGRKLSFPVVVKPRTSRPLTNPFHRLVVVRANDQAELLDVARQMLTESECLEVQEFFTGRGVGVELLIRDGEVLLAFQHLRLHEPIGGGGSSYRRGMAIDQRMYADSVRLLSLAGLNGIAMVEFKWNPATNAYVYIEVNCRLWGSIPLAIASGADFPAMWIDALVGMTPPRSKSIRTTLHCRSLDADVVWFASNLRARSNDPTLNRVAMTTIVREAVMSTILGRERYDSFAIDDPAPAFREVRAIARRLWGGLSCRATKRWRTLGFVRSREQARLARYLQPGARLLVLCKGNICRSPYLGARLGKHVPVESVGFLSTPSRPSPPEAIAAAADRGIDLRDHRSAQITGEAVDRAAAVLVFDDEGLDVIRKRYRRALSKTFMAGVALEHGPWEVPDPYGRGNEAFAACYARLDEVAAAITARLTVPR